MVPHDQQTDVTSSGTNKVGLDFESGMAAG